MEGLKFSRLTVESKARSRFWNCVCVCGESVVVREDSLKAGNTKSCGCLQREHAKKITHGMSHTRTYNTWAGMLQRCNNPNATAYPNYGAVGISVCVRWKSFENFMEDMGERPNGCSIERINRLGDYTPGNCCWASIYEQNRNRKNTKFILFKGKKKTLTEWSKEVGIGYWTLRSRLDLYGWPVDLAFSIPTRRGIK